MKRRAVILVTFAAGLFYFLEFLLPARIGGAPNADGAASGCFARTAGGAEAILYSGASTDAAPVILRRAGARPTSAAVELTTSFARRDDYRGLTAPQAVGADRLYYIGLGWDDRVPRLCMARRTSRGWQAEPRAVLDRGTPGSPDASGVTWASVLPPSAGETEWRLWYIARQGEVGRIGAATSVDGMRWRKAGFVPAAPPVRGASIESVSVERTAGGLRAWLVAGPSKRAMAVYTAAVDMRTSTLREMRAVALDGAPARAIVRDARALADRDVPGGVRLLLTVASGVEGKPRIVLARTDPGVDAAVARVEPAPVALPGRPAHTTYLSDYRGTVDDLIVVLGAFAVGLGLVSLAQVHGERILRLRRGWAESVVFFAAAISMTGFTLYARIHPDSRGFGAKGYDLLFTGFFQPLGSAMFSLLAAYLVSAAYRAFKVRNLEATLMAVSAALVMLGQVPVGGMMTRWLPHALQIPTIMTWILFVANNAVVRAVNFGIFVGALATALRVWLSMDRATMRSFE